MKKLLLMAAALGIAFSVVLGLSAVHYQNTKIQKIDTAAKHDADLIAPYQAELSTLKTSEATATKKVASIRVECEKGKVAYDKLTIFAKGQTAAPNCAVL
jgi:hypothetical protein